MKPEVWVPALATLLAALVPLVITGINRLKKSKKDHELGGSGSAKTRRRRGGKALELRPAAEEFLQHRPHQAAGYQYDRDMLPDLVRVYTKNDLTSGGEAPTEPRTEEAAARTPGPVTERRISFEKLLLDPKVKHIAITGEAGIGKTSLLGYWDHHLRHLPPCAQDPVTRYRPVLVAARNLVGCGSVAAGLGGEGTRLLDEPPGRDLTWLVMVDAFDEVIDAGDRAEVERIVFEAIEHASGAESPCKFVVTTRGLTDVRRRSFDSRGISEYKLQPFTREQLRQFLIRQECNDADREVETTEYRAAATKADRFLNRWEGHDDLLELIQLPLLARVAATIYFQDSRLDIPARRIDVYHDAIEHWLAQFHKRMSSEEARLGPALRLLREWYAGTGGPNPDDTDHAARVLLARLATRYLETGQRSVVAIGCEVMGIPLRPKEPDRFEALLTLLEATGLVYDVRAMAPKFLHKSFAEYLAAPLQMGMYATLDDWDQAFRDPELRTGAVFAFAHLDAHTRRALITAFESDDRYLLVCGWIAAEGLCIEGRTGGIDEEQRNHLIDRCVTALPPTPPEEWWQLINALASVEYARDRFHQLVIDLPFRPWTLLRIARAIAKQDQRGTELLRRFATDPRFDGIIQVDAAEDLLEYDRTEAASLLERHACRDDFQYGVRLQALRAICKHNEETGVPQLREFTLDPTMHGFIRVMAATSLVEYDEEIGLELLRGYATAKGTHSTGRVLAAERLADWDPAEAEHLLRRYAADTAFPHFARIQAANALVNLDRENGIAALRRFTADGGIDDSAQIQAAYRLFEHGQSGALEMLRDSAMDKGVEPCDRLMAARFLETEDPKFSKSIFESVADDTANADQDRITAVNDLAYLDRSTWLPVVGTFANDPSVDSTARVTALLCFIDHDREQGLRRIRELDEVQGLDDDSRLEVLSCQLINGETSVLTDIWAIVENPLWNSSTRVQAAMQISRREPTARLGLLMDLARDESIDDCDRVEALSELAFQHGQAGYEPLLALAEDCHTHGSARVEAAEQLVKYRRSEGLALLRRLARDLDLHDEERVNASRYLAHHEPEEGIAMLQRFSSQPDLNDSARLQAVLAMLRHDKEPALELLHAMANDTSLEDSIPIDAAHWLARHDHRSDGIDRLRAYTSEAAIDDPATLIAARNLMAFDPEAGLDALAYLASNSEGDPYVQVEAAWNLMQHSNAEGMRLLRMFNTDPEQDQLRAVLAETRLARFDPATGRQRLAALTADVSYEDSARVEAADALARFDRTAGVAAIRHLAAGQELSDPATTVAARGLTKFDRQNGIVLLRSFANAKSLEVTARVSAANDLVRHHRAEGLELLRGFIADPTFDGFAKVNAARWLTYQAKVEGIATLRQLCSDPSLGKSVHCWAHIALADRDLEARASLVQTFGANESVDIEALRRSSAALIKLHGRAGHRAARHVRTIAKA